ncbi:glycoside hydrolase family 5 protein [Clostridium sp. SM-530-WT-3G]|uniref:glycoside hydrolase family 5 protein n=1 Tax=Clostridium sp. SM-530-WT-3G TaxID=2725303 RepID=UPI00145C549B|nr:glycoside hydrolase family 5 protein [Clostridium sp. SM-530-WT-3G]NME83092.1 glycoside hydrolase family 5 protein [Clostridium sp. SM-530-WT-3G]
MNGKRTGKILVIISVIFITWLFMKSNFFNSIIDSKITSKNYGVPFKRCISIGNELEASKNISRDIGIKNEYFDIVKDVGFDCVRLPISFADYVSEDYYKLDEDYMTKIDSYINYALNDDLTIIIDFHNFVEIMNNPEANKECFLVIWNQLSERYKDYPRKLIFELLNEPQNNLEGEVWNEYLAEGIDVIRKNDKSRKIIVGPDHCNSVDRLYNLKVPRDKNLIVTFHYYEPYDFTFQGNECYEGYRRKLGVKWNGTEEELLVIKNKFEIAKKWSKDNKIGIFLGEFGADKKAEGTDRKRWIGAVRKRADKDYFAWGYRELCSDFGIYDNEAKQWDNDVLSQLIPN